MVPAVVLIACLGVVYQSLWLGTRTEQDLRCERIVEPPMECSPKCAFVEFALVADVLFESACVVLPTCCPTIVSELVTSRPYLVMVDPLLGRNFRWEDYRTWSSPSDVPLQT